MVRSNLRGVTLGESIIACFVLTFAMLISATMYHTALQYSVKIDRKQRAARVAEQRVEEIRSWSRRHHGTNGDLEFSEGWEEFDDTTFSDPDNPGYTVRTEIDPKDLFSPSSEFEKVYFAAQEDDTIPDGEKVQRSLADSSYLATVTVTWGSGPSEKLVTRTLLTDPVRDHGWDANEAHKAITLSYNSNGAWQDEPPEFMNPKETLRLRAEVQDRHGQAVKNPVVTWYVDADSTGKGTIESRPNTPASAVFTNEVTIDKDPQGTGDEMKVLTGGSVRLIARVRLGGIEAVSFTPTITLRD